MDVRHKPIIIAPATHPVDKICEDMFETKKKR